MKMRAGRSVLWAAMERLASLSAAARGGSAKGAWRGGVATGGDDAGFCPSPDIEQIVVQALRHVDGRQEVRRAPGAVAELHQGDILSLRIRARDEEKSIARELAEGVQVLTVLNRGEDAARFDVDLPAGTHLVANADGGLNLMKGEEYVRAFEPPWAVDAKGAHLPTSYEVSGGLITQSVDTTHASFPVVVDPSARFCGRFPPRVCVKLDRSETKRANDAALAGVGAFTATFCGLIPSVPPPLLLFKASCFAIVAAYWTVLRGVFKRAQETRRCVELKFALGGGLVGWKVVKC